jgi:adenosine deaminase
VTEGGYRKCLGYNPEYRFKEDFVSHARALVWSFLILVTGAMSAQPKPVHRAEPIAEARTARYLDSVRQQPSLLLAFLRAMPKGGDLHNHLSGAIYAEDYIRWAAEDGICLNRQTFAFAPSPCDAEKSLVPATQILQDPALYQNVINALSMRFFNGPESGHDHFFNTFMKFGAVSRNHTGEMLAALMAQAAADRVGYVEVILGLDKGGVSRLVADKAIAFNGDLAALRQALLEVKLGNVVADSRKNLDEAEAQAREVLHCGSTQAQPGCTVSVLYQYEVRRGLPSTTVFADMLTGFELAKSDSRVLAINPVMPEDAYVPMHDFALHMRMIDYLHGLYPNVHLSLHGGELWPGLVPEQGLRDHIRQSIDVGHAQRIGHGVDVMFEEDPVGLLKAMAAKKIAVEINLVSNDQILGVRGDAHPLPIYLEYGVPVALSTDDEGVSRSDMTEQYIRAATEYHLSYPTLKQIVRNSLEYSFVPGESLWKDSSYSRFSAQCGSDAAGAAKLSTSCDQFLGKSQKARLQWQLEDDFRQFEAKSCCNADPKQLHSVR